MAEETKVRTYEPPEEFARQANVDDASVYEEAARDYEGFWAERARELHWFEEWDRVLDWDPPEAQWFVGGKLNVSYNCLDYQVELGRGDKTAILWQGDEPADSDAGLCPHRCSALRRLRRFLGGFSARPHQRLRGEGPRHRRRRAEGRQGDALE